MNTVAWDNSVRQGCPGIRPCAIKREIRGGGIELPMPPRPPHLITCHWPRTLKCECPQHPLVASAFAQTPTIGRPTSTLESPRFWVAIWLPPPSRTGWAAPHDKSRPAPACHPLQIWPSASTQPPPEYISDLNFRACHAPMARGQASCAPREAPYGNCTASPANSDLKFEISAPENP